MKELRDLTDFDDTRCDREGAVDQGRDATGEDKYLVFVNLSARGKYGMIRLWCQ